jgi:hypothetical protein
MAAASGPGERHEPARAAARTPGYKAPAICYRWSRADSINRARETVMAKGQMKSNKEKKKPKADKNLKKGGIVNVNPFASSKTPAGQSPNSKKN